MNADGMEVANIQFEEREGFLYAFVSGLQESLPFRSIFVNVASEIANSVWLKNRGPSIKNLERAPAYLDGLSNAARHLDYPI